MKRDEAWIGLILATALGVWLNGWRHPIYGWWIPGLLWIIAITEKARLRERIRGIVLEAMRFAS